MAKILIWKLFTTTGLLWTISNSCFRYGKDTNLKAIHNRGPMDELYPAVVSDMAKILIWKLFTTILHCSNGWFCCFRYGKDTNLKAIHNAQAPAESTPLVVSDMAKILIWKLFTTTNKKHNSANGCFRYGKDTNLKAIHNLDSGTQVRDTLFPIWQRY